MTTLKLGSWLSNYNPSDTVGVVSELYHNPNAGLPNRSYKRVPGRYVDLWRQQIIA